MDCEKKCRQNLKTKPLVIISKQSKQVRLCVDYKYGINERLIAENY